MGKFEVERLGMQQNFLKVFLNARLKSEPHLRMLVPTVDAVETTTDALALKAATWFYALLCFYVPGYHATQNGPTLYNVGEAWFVREEDMHQEVDDTLLAGYRTMFEENLKASFTG